MDSSLCYACWKCRHYTEWPPYSIHHLGFEEEITSIKLKLANTERNLSKKTFQKFLVDEHIKTWIPWERYVSDKREMFDSFQK